MTRLNHPFRRLAVAGLFILLVGLLHIGEGSVAQAQDQMANMPEQMKKQMMRMTPERRKLVLALSPETRKTLFAMFSKHTRHSKNATLRQVMHELQVDLQGVLTGILTDNGEMAADHARRMANHRIPSGGMIPYLPAEAVNDETLSSLTGFNQIIEGGAQELVGLAENGDIAGAADKISDIVGGCVACHAIFRGQPGVSANVMPMKE